MEEYLKIKRSPNYSGFILFLKGGLKAVFKTKTTVGEGSYYSNVLAYRFSQFMNWKLVPPTVIRKINGKKGSVQLFIDSMKFKPKKLTSFLTSVQKSNIFTHYFVLGDYDGKEDNILLGKSCGNPALIDNDSVMESVFILYGDYPFVRYPIGNFKFFVSNYKEFEKFPIDKIQSISIEKIKILEHFNNLNLYQSYLNIKPKKFHFVKWKNSYWVKLNFPYYFPVYKDFLPIVFSKKIISKLKMLNENTLISFLKPGFFISNEKVSGILYRRNIILRESIKLKDYSE